MGSEEVADTDTPRQATFADRIQPFRFFAHGNDMPTVLRLYRIRYFAYFQRKRRIGKFRNHGGVAEGAQVAALCGRTVGGYVFGDIFKSFAIVDALFGRLGFIFRGH